MKLLTRSTRRSASAPPSFALDPLEPRFLLSAALDLIGVNALRADPTFAGIDGSGVSVAVIDTGVDFTHPLLSAAKVAAHDFVRNNDDSVPTAEHGTHVAGIIGARDADIGVATGVGLIGLQVFTPAQGGNVVAYDTDTEQALDWVYDHHTQYNIVAVNMSLGSGNYTSAIQGSGSILYDDVQRLQGVGVTVVSAAGNGYPTNQVPGSAVPGVFSTLDVGAVYESNVGTVTGSGQSDRTTAADRVTFFSQRPNTANELFAPGAFINSTVPGGGTEQLSGTSMASPMVAGVVALMQDAAETYGGRLLTPNEVQTIIQQTADTIVDGDDEDTTVQTTGGSYLRVNAYHAVQFIHNEFTGASSGSTDPNGTIASAVNGPTLSGVAVAGLTGNVGSDGSTFIGAKDVDITKFTVTSPGPITVSAVSSTFRPLLRIFASSGTALGSNSPASPGTATLTITLAAGTYYAGVSGAPNSTYDPNTIASGVSGATGNYTLNFGQGQTDIDGVLSAATPINLSSGDTPQALNFSIGMDGTRSVGGGDVDFFQVSAPDNGTLLVDIDTLTTPFADTYLRVFDASGTQIFTSDDDLATDLNGNPVEFDNGSGGVVDGNRIPAGHTTDSFISASVTRGSLYYVAVCNFANRAFDPDTLSGRVTTGSTGQYSLFVSLRSHDYNGAIPQAISTAVLPIVKKQGTIGSDGTPDGVVQVGDRDVDFIKLNSPTAGILQLDVDSEQNATPLADKVDTVLRLFDANGNLLAASDDDAGVDPLLQFQIAANTDYYAAVAGLGNNSFDPYVLGSGGSGDTGDYFFSANILASAQAAALSNDVIGNGEVQQLLVNARRTERIGDDNGFVRGDTDVDLYTFIAPFTGQFTFTAGASDDFGCDTFLRLFNADGTQIAEDDNSLGATGGSKIISDLTAGADYVVGVSGAGPNADSYDPLTGAGAGSGSTGGYFLEADAGARSIAFGGKTKATFRDADGSLVVVSLKGPGTGTVVFDSDANEDPIEISLLSTTGASALSIKGDTSVKGLSVTGSIKSISAKTMDFSGNLTVSGNIRALQLRTISDATINLGAGLPASFAAVDVFDSSITAAAALTSVRISTWTDTDATADVITTPLLGSLASKGDFGADIEAGRVGNLKIGGDLSGDVRSSGSIASVSVASITGASVFAGVTDGFVGLPALLTDFSNPTATIASLAVRGKFTGAFSGASIAAPIIRKASIGNAATANNGTSFGVAAHFIGSISGLFDGAEKLKLRSLSDPSQSLIRTDLSIRLV